MPDLPLLCGAAALHGPFLLTSANRHGHPPARTCDEAVSTLHGVVGHAIDGPVHGRRQVGPGGREAFTVGGRCP